MKGFQFKGQIFLPKWMYLDGGSLEEMFHRRSQIWLVKSVI